MRLSLKLIIALFALSLTAPLLAACNTTAGLGEDVSAGGHALTNAAQKAKP